MAPFGIQFRKAVRRLASRSIWLQKRPRPWRRVTAWQNQAMRIPRVHLPVVLHEGAEHDLPAGAVDRLVRVLRLPAGREVRVFDGRGAEFKAILVEAGKRGARILVQQSLPAAAASPLRVTLAQALARGEKMDWILQKATELGVASIQPILTERTEVRLGEERSERRMAHWRGILTGACEQSGRADLPSLESPLSLPEWLAQLVGVIAPVDQMRVFLDPEADSEFAATDFEPRALIAAVGPEGGFSARELSMFAQARFEGCRLGPRVLRTETAGIAVLAIAQARWGDLGRAG